MEDTKQYQLITYSTEGFWLEEGYYTLEELEILIKNLKEVSAQHNEALKRSMKEV